MPRLLVILLSFTLLLVGCNSTPYKDEEVAAVVNGEEITVGELRFLYPDDRILDYLEWMVTVELIKQEVEEMELPIEEAIRINSEDDAFAQLPPKDTADEGGKQIRKYAQSQARKLKITPEQFQKEYAQKISEQNTYVIAYFEAMLGEVDYEDEQEFLEFNEKADVLLEQLRSENEANVEILIN